MAPGPTLESKVIIKEGNYGTKGTAHHANFSQFLRHFAQLGMAKWSKYDYKRPLYGYNIVRTRSHLMLNGSSSLCKSGRLLG